MARPANDQSVCCKGCRFWKPAPDIVDGKDLGICRRFPPAYEGWPMTGPDDWCAEWKKNGPTHSSEA